MEQIGLYFKKFEGLGTNEHQAKKKLVEAILEVITAMSEDDIDTKKIVIKDNKINILISGPLKNEIILNKKEIENKFFEKIGVKKRII